MGKVYGLRYDKSYYLKKLIEKYGDKFKYDKVEFNSLSDYIILICSKHGIEFKIQLNSVSVGVFVDYGFAYDRA